MPVAEKKDEKAYTYHVTREDLNPATPQSPSMTSDPDAQAADQDQSTESKAQQAYDPETGTINWDCPCIAGMVEPPCGDLFKAAFSCFVYSEAEPKGADCIEQFREMQACFQAHPEKYAVSDEDDDNDEDEDDDMPEDKDAER
ncbi:MAG: hypothetical protein SGCHY_002253 [Lobulomycetales sp.]